MTDDLFIDINCDVGEGIGNEVQLMPFMSSCNIACGGHAGDQGSMLEVAKLAKKFSVKVGAHPSYPDPENFGRVSMKIQNSRLVESIQNQMSSFESILKEQDIVLNHIKAHGALYNDIRRDSDLARTFLKSIDGFKDTALLYVPYGSAIEKEAHMRGFSTKREAFADRNYNLDLSLVPRQRVDAVITSPEEVLENLLRMVKEKHILTKEGIKVYIHADTFCIHGDTPSAFEILNYLSTELPKVKIHIKK